MYKIVDVLYELVVLELKLMLSDVEFVRFGRIVFLLDVEFRGKILIFYVFMYIFCCCCLENLNEMK